MVYLILSIRKVVSDRLGPLQIVKPRLPALKCLQTAFRHLFQDGIGGCPMPDAGFGEFARLGSDLPKQHAPAFFKEHAAGCIVLEAAHFHICVRRCCACFLGDAYGIVIGMAARRRQPQDVLLYL